MFSFLISMVALGNPTRQEIEQIIELSHTQKIGQTLKWRRLLFIPDRWYSSDVSLIDDPKFFIAQNGKNDPQAELEATLRSMLSKKIIRKKQTHCLYPARYHFLNQKLDLKKLGIDIADCDKLQRFLKFADYEAVSLVFSSYFINSPGSAFGHTLFRLHRKNKVRRSALLDDSINFSAFVPQFNALFYPFQGLAGKFKGRFSMLPYYKKIQEYNNEESRDVWEYQLNLSKEEIDELVYLMVEVGEVYFDYYYLDDNCSYVILTLLEAIRPNLKFSKQYTMYAIPGDTLRTVFREKDLVSKINYRPSALSRYLIQHKNLHKNEQALFGTLISSKDIDVIQKSSCDESCRVKIYDTAIEYIDYEEKLTGVKKAIRFKGLRKQLLLRRAQIAIHSAKIDATPLTSPPHLGHNSNMIALFTGMDTNQNSFVDFQWRPAMLDLSSNEVGYSNEMQIKFLDMRFRFFDNMVQVKNIEFLDLTSLPKAYPNIKTSAWTINLAYHEIPDCFENIDYCKRTNINFGKGFSHYLLREKLLIYEFLNGDLIFSNSNNQRANVSPMTTVGFMYTIPGFYKLNGQAKYRVPLIDDLEEDLFIQLKATKMFSESDELKLIYNRTNSYEEYLIGYRKYL